MDGRRARIKNGTLARRGEISIAFIWIVSNEGAVELVDDGSIEIECDDGDAPALKAQRKRFSTTC